MLIGETLMRADDVEAACRGLAAGHERHFETLRRLFSPHSAGVDHAAPRMTARALAIPLAAAVLGGGVTAGILLGTGAVGDGTDDDDRAAVAADLAAPARDRGPPA